MKKKQLFAICCAVCLFILAAAQFFPYWTYGEAGESISIQKYVWFPTNYADVTTYIAQATGNDAFTTGDMVLMPILTFVLALAGIALCILKGTTPFAPIATIATGCVGILGYCLTPALRIGNPFGIHLLICIVTALIGLFALRIKEEAQA